MIRLAIARQRYNPYSGTESYMLRALESLSQQHDLSVTLLARDWPPACENMRRWNWQRVDPMCVGRVWRERSFRRAVQELGSGFDILQTHERIPGAMVFRANDGVHATWVEQYARIKNPAGRLWLKFSAYHRMQCRAEREMFAHPALRCVICPSKMVRDDIKRRFQLADDKLYVVYHGVDTTHFSSEKNEKSTQLRQQLHIPENSPVLAFAGSGFLRKGLLTALRAVAAFPEVYLLVAGDDRNRGEYERQAKNLGISVRVRFLGAVDDHRPLFGAADALVLPALYEPFPLVCLEALAAGLPVFTSPTCGIAELIVPDQSGWINDALDVEKLKQSMANWLKLWNEPYKRAKLRENARHTALPYTVESGANALVALYRRFF